MDENTILIVDDDADVSRVLKKRLEDKSYTVICASDGYEALYKYVKEQPGLIILDVMLPKLNGYEVCREIRRELEDVTTPIIMMTGTSEDYGRIKGKVVGANKYLTKPLKFDWLMDAINDVSEGRV